MKRHSIITPCFDTAPLELLRAGDSVMLSGTIYTARDAAHKRMTEALGRCGELPFPISGQAIYYAGPCPAKPGRIIGSCGPTTSGRMDAYAPELIALGLKIMIGKGPRSATVIEAMKKYGAVYLCAVGGAGALISECVRSVAPVAYDDLGTEAVTLLTVENMPLTVGIDMYGGSVFK